MRFSPNQFFATIGAIAFFCSTGDAQTAPATNPTTNAANSTIVTRMMQFDKNADGKLSRDEITDNRFMALFEQADANHDETVTREELIAVAMVLDTPGDAPRGGRAGRAGRGPAPDGRGMPLDGRGGRGPRGGPDGRGPGGPPTPP